MSFGRESWSGTQWPFGAKPNGSEQKGTTLFSPKIHGRTCSFGHSLEILSPTTTSNGLAWPETSACQRTLGGLAVAGSSRSHGFCSSAGPGVRHLCSFQHVRVVRFAGFLHSFYATEGSCTIYSVGMNLKKRKNIGVIPTIPTE